MGATFFEAGFASYGGWGIELPDKLRLLYSPTWAIAFCGLVFILTSLVVERTIHYIRQFLRKREEKDLEEALEKIKEELMLVGFVSLVLAFCGDAFSKICVPVSWVRVMHQCHNQTIYDEIEAMDYGTCKTGKSPFISVTALHQLHILLFLMVVVHVVISILTMALAKWKVHMWKAWEDRAVKKEQLVSCEPGIRYTKETTFVQARTQSMWTKNPILAYVHAFFSIFMISLSEAEYETLRHGFIQSHVSGHLSFNFHKYILRTLEDDFKYVVGVSTILWGYYVLLLLVNVNGWQAYVWSSIIPLLIVLMISTELEHIITKMAVETVNRSTVVTGIPNVMLSDELFWFKSPKLILHFIHFILFQSAITISSHLWGIFTFEEYSFSCLFRSKLLNAVSLILEVISLTLFGYHTLPTYALVSQMGSSLKRSIFQEHIHAALADWHQRAAKHSGSKDVELSNAPEQID